MFIPASNRRLALVWRQVCNMKSWSSSRPIRFFVRSHHDLRFRLDGIVPEVTNSVSSAAVSCDMGTVLGVSVFVFHRWRSEEHTSELQSLMRISYAVFCLNKKQKIDDEYETKSD